MSDFPMRINKYLAKEKIASRREADVLLEAKKSLSKRQSSGNWTKN